MVSVLITAMRSGRLVSKLGSVTRRKSPAERTIIAFGPRGVTPQFSRLNAPSSDSVPSAPMEYFATREFFNPAKRSVPAGLIAMPPDEESPAGRAKGEPGTGERLPSAAISKTEMLFDPVGGSLHGPPLMANRRPPLVKSAGDVQYTYAADPPVA